MNPGKENAKPSIREWTFPPSPNLSNPGPSSSSQQPSSTSSSSSARAPAAEAVHGRSSSSAHNLASNNPKRGLTGPSNALGSIKEGGGGGGGSSKGGIDALRHRTNASVFAATMGGGGANGQAVSFPRSPQQAVKMVYSNVRRKSLHDLAYSILFVGSLLLFAYSVTGMGYDASSSSALSKSAALLAKKAQPPPLATVNIPDTFLPSRDDPPVDQHQPHGDSSHDTGEDLLQDSPNDDKLNDENLHRHVQDKEDALFAAGHQEAERELDSKLGRVKTPEELEEEEDLERADDTVPERNDEDDAEVESERAPEEERTAAELDAQSEGLVGHDHDEHYLEHAEERRQAALAALREAQHLGEGARGVTAHEHEEGEVELDLSRPDQQEGDDQEEEEEEEEEDQDQDDSVQDDEDQEDTVETEQEAEQAEVDEELAALPEAARRRRTGSKRRLAKRDEEDDQLA